MPTQADPVRAAHARVFRRMGALMMAVAQVVEVERAVFSEVGDPLEMAVPRLPAEVAEELERLHRLEENHWQPTDEGPPEWVCMTPLQCRKGVKQDAAEDPETDPVGYTAAVGQAD